MGFFGPVTMKTLALDLQRDVGNIELFMQQLRHLSEEIGRASCRERVS